MNELILGTLVIAASNTVIQLTQMYIDYKKSVLDNQHEELYHSSIPSLNFNCCATITSTNTTPTNTPREETVIDNRPRAETI